MRYPIESLIKGIYSIYSIYRYPTESLIKCIYSIYRYPTESPRIPSFPTKREGDEEVQGALGLPDLLKNTGGAM